jgi:hypothetical protein
LLQRAGLQQLAAAEPSWLLAAQSALVKGTSPTFLFALAPLLASRCAVQRMPSRLSMPLYLLRPDSLGCALLLALMCTKATAQARITRTLRGWLGFQRFSSLLLSAPFRGSLELAAQPLLHACRQPHRL